jgi:hypothetical protein
MIHQNDKRFLMYVYFIVALAKLSGILFLRFIFSGIILDIFSYFNLIPIK